ncbi:MAG: class I SAM-dependent methyltransferase [Clostridia bacterium]|nr:class I SAM-dependent methyltransferase [Clostridia bacterium]
MDKKEIAAFFDSFADSWDSDMSKIQWKIDKILDTACVTEGKTVLDTGCGTGVLIPDYISRKVRKCIAVDISENMIKIAKSKFSEYENIVFLCADAETYEPGEKFDCIVIYNAFPHFANRKLLFKNLSEHLKEDGRITVAHGMSREALIKHHSGKAQKISSVLPEADELAEIMKPYFNIDTKISTDEIYIVSGRKNI